MWSTLSYNRIRSLDSWCPTYAVNTFNLRVLALFIPLNPPKCLTSKDFCFSAFLLRSNTELGKDTKRCSNRGWAHEQGEDVSCQPHHTPGKADPSIYVQENERHLHIGRTQSVALLPIRFWSISGLKAGFVGKKKKNNSIFLLKSVPSEPSKFITASTFNAHWISQGYRHLLKRLPDLENSCACIKPYQTGGYITGTLLHSISSPAHTPFLSFSVSQACLPPLNPSLNWFYWLYILPVIFCSSLPSESLSLLPISLLPWLFFSVCSTWPWASPLDLLGTV